MGLEWPGRVRRRLVSILAGGCGLALGLVAALPAGSVAAMSPGGIQLTQSGGTMTESASLFVGNPGENLGVSVSGNANVTYASGPAQITMVGSPRNVGGSEGVFNSFMDIGFSSPGTYTFNANGLVEGTNVASFTVIIVDPTPATPVSSGIRLTQSGSTVTASPSRFVGTPGSALGVSVTGNANVTYASGPAQITMVGSPRNVGGSEGVFNSFMDIGFSSPGTYVFNASGLVEGTNTVTFTVAISFPPQASPTQSPAANGSGWNSGDVTVNWNWTDAGGGIINPGACAQTSTASGQGSVTVSASCANVDGNVGQASYTAKIDSVAPSVSLSGFQPNGANGWFKTSPATGTVTAGDATSGVASVGCTDNGSPLAVGSGGALSVTGDGTHAVSCTATDVAGNTSGAATTTVRIDTAMPTITAAAATADGHAYTPGTWTRQPVTVSFACSDDGPDTVTCSQPVTVSQDGENQSVTGTATDQAGNTASATVSGIDVDATAPQLSASQSPAANANGWNNTGVNVILTATDGVSGVASLTYALDGGSATTVSGGSASVGVTGDGAHTLTYSAVDNAGSTAQGQPLTIQIDTVKPTISGATDRAANGAGWFNAPVTVSFTCADGGSGVASCSGPMTLSSDGQGQQVSGAATDKAGNAATDSVGGINIDQTAPDVSAQVSPAPNANGWNNSAVAVTLTATDNLSGVRSITYTLDGGSATTVSGGSASVDVTGEGAHTLTYSAVDNAGNTAQGQPLTIQIDTVKPTISGATDRAANGAGWFNAPVTVTFTCADGGSGVASCSGPTTLSSDGQGQQVTGTAIDKSGNQQTATVTVNLDQTAPTVTYSVPTGTTYTVDQPVTITCTASDALSGIASSTCANISGPAYTFGVGTHSYSATATDQAGNSASASISFTVANSTTSLGNLVTQFTASAPAGTASSLNSKLQAATVATNSTSRNNQLNAFIHEVQAQSGKNLSVSQAVTLIQLAQTLEAK